MKIDQILVPSWYQQKTQCHNYLDYHLIRFHTMFRSSYKIFNSQTSAWRLVFPSSLGGRRALFGSWTFGGFLALTNEITTIDGPAWWCDTWELFFFCANQIENLFASRQILAAYIANNWHIFHRIVVVLNRIITGDVRGHNESLKELLLRLVLRNYERSSYSDPQPCANTQSNASFGNIGFILSFSVEVLSCGHDCHIFRHKHHVNRVSPKKNRPPAVGDFFF